MAVEEKKFAMAACCCLTLFVAGVIVYCIFLPGTIPYFFLFTGILVFAVATGSGWGALCREVFNRGQPLLPGSVTPKRVDSIVNHQGLRDMDPFHRTAAFSVLGGLLFPISLPLLMGLGLYRKTQHTHRVFAAVGLAVVGWVAFGIALAYIFIWLCAVSTDSPCDGRIDMPTDFILNESVLATRMEFTVNDMDDKTMGHRRFLTKRTRRCNAPGAPFKYTETMEYRDASDKIVIYADLRAIYLRDPSAPWEIWDIHDCNNNLLFTIEEQLLSKLTGWWNEWTIRDSKGVAVAISDRFQLWVTMTIEVQDAQTKQIIGNMTQNAFQLKFRFITHVTNATRLPEYMYGFIGMLTKRALDEKKKS